MENSITSREVILEIWGDKFEEFTDHPQIKFKENSIEVVLKTPIPGVDGPQNTVPLKIPNAGQMRELDQVKGDIAKTLTLIRLCSGLPGASVDKLKSNDLSVIEKIVAAFL